MKLISCLPILIAPLLVACASTTPTRLDPVPLTAEEIEFLRKLEDPETFSLVQDTPALFHNLDSLLNAWLESSLSKNSPKHVRIYTNLGEILTRRVYVNFETILDQFHNGPPPNRIIAAAALGFSRIPENDSFPAVHTRAIDALISDLDCGDDSVIKNILLSLYNLADPATPLTRILDIMVQHHDPDVRANASLAVQAIATEDKADLILPYMFPGLKDDEPKVRNHCILIAMKLKDKGAITALVELLKDSYALIQANAAVALGEMGDSSLCGSLIPLLNSRYQIVRECVLKSLKKLSGEDYGFELEDWKAWWNEGRES